MCKDFNNITQECNENTNLQCTCILSCTRLHSRYNADVNTSREADVLCPRLEDQSFSNMSFSVGAKDISHVRIPNFVNI